MTKSFVTILVSLMMTMALTVNEADAQVVWQNVNQIDIVTCHQTDINAPAMLTNVDPPPRRSLDYCDTTRSTCAECLTALVNAAGKGWHHVYLSFENGVLISNEDGSIVSQYVVILRNNLKSSRF